MEAHETAVSQIQAQVRKFYELQTPYRIYHGSTNSTRDSQRSEEESVNTSQLTNVLHVDRQRKTAVVEPNVPMDAFVRETYAHGLVPLVVMEFPGITVGGGFSGTSGESSSYRYGFFDNSVNWIEIILGDGRIEKADRTKQPELFWGAASSFGTLGVITLLEVQLRDAAPYVALRYMPFSTMGAALASIEAQVSNKEVDYIDGIVFSQSNIVICAGSLYQNVPAGARVQTFTRRQDPWFYLDVQRQTQASLSEPVTVYVPLVDYLFRYDRGGFWVGRYAFRYFMTPFNRITRYILDRFMHTRVMYHALHASGQSRLYIIQDVAIPYQGATEFHNWLDSTFSIYPIWLCPLRQRRDDPNAQHGLYKHLGRPDTPEFMLNFGIWGPGARNRHSFIQQNRLLEHKVDALGGRKWLYAHAYYTESEFWSIYDRKSYDGLRSRYGAQYLPSVFDKVKINVEAEETAMLSSWMQWLVFLFWSIWPLSGIYGVFQAWKGGDYLMQKKSAATIQSMKSH